jgi:hypothetical protein
LQNQNQRGPRTVAATMGWFVTVASWLFCDGGGRTERLAPLEVVLLRFRILRRENGDLEYDANIERLYVAVWENVCGGMETDAAWKD